MPLYDVEHTTPLNSSQRKALANAITKIHSETFTTPKLFVNVRFVDLRQRKGEVLFVAGEEKHATNRIIANVRPSPSRTQAIWDDICTKLSAAWTDIVINNPIPSPQLQKAATASSPNSNSNSSRSDHRQNSFLSNESKPSISDLKVSAAADDKQLRAIFILGSITAGQEVGFSLPVAGEDGKWIRENMKDFERLAGDGDEEMRDLVEEIGARGLLEEKSNGDGDGASGK